MSAFEVNITPVRLKSKRSEGMEPTLVVMAPFSSKAVVTFQDVPVTKTAKRILRVYNPSQEPIEVNVTKFIRAEHNISMTWTKNIVPAEDEVEMEMIWNPTIEITCKETLQLIDNRNFRKDVMVILKSVSNKSISKSIKRYPTISSTTSHVKTLRLKSPTGPKPNRHRQSPNYKAQKTDRLSPVTISRQINKPKNQISPLVERNVPHIVLSHVTDVPHQPPSRSQIFSNVFKENVSPLSPDNVLDIIDNMQFTPATNTKPKREDANDIDYLSSLPTPISRNTVSNHLDEAQLIREIRPRRLKVAVESSEDELSPMNIRVKTKTNCAKTVIEMERSEIDGDLDSLHTQVINNKTFELKVLDKSDSFTDFQENLENASKQIILNKTATLTPAVSRPLSMIEEEEAHSSQNILQKTYDISKVDDHLKRDIKLIGTPLRKYSESMKDLSLKSPSSKLPIQGSMPNLNEMENIRSIEQNRYFHTQKVTSTIERKSYLRSKSISLDDSDGSNASFVSCSSQVDLLFNQNEILAQSSRFNLNEIGKKTLKSSPLAMPPPLNQRRITPTKSSKKLIGSPVNIVGNKRYRDISMLDSPGSDTSTLHCPRTNVISVSPPKRAKIENESVYRYPNSASRGIWSHVQPKTLRLSKTLSLAKKPVTPRKFREEQIVKLYDSEMYMQSFINPDPFAATTTVDPFLASTMYLDEQSVEKHRIAFKKWLNALVSIPAELDPDCNQKIDVGRLFNEARTKELILAPTKEEQSMHYLTKHRLENLRHEAVRFFMSEEMHVPCSKVAVYVQKSAIRIRKDRDLHLDIVMQRNILELLLCFNPLWLRLGLEVVFAEKIHLHSCSDIVGLSAFIVNRLFKDKYIEQKYSRAYTLSDEYGDYIKKFTLQKVLFLLLFLDKAKTKRIIKHNPCLFVKKSPYKEVREILLRFSSEMLGNVGDITKDLRRIGYVLTHKQTFLDEFNYAFSNLAVDLRDGIRLARVMEIILMRDDLSKQLRVPAISRLQRIFNVNLSLRALEKADFQLRGDIVSADIVDGHREKTLSLLWQIIYKFRSPKFHAAASTIQRWWRNSWLSVCIRRRIRVKIEKRRNVAATIIQSAFRGFMSRKFVKIYRWERTIAAICLQKYVRRYLVQKRFVRTIHCVVHIQRWYRAFKYGSAVRHAFVEFRNSVIYIQRWLRRVKLARKISKAAEVICTIQTEARLRHRKAIVIQRFLKSILLRRKFQKVVLDIVCTINTSKIQYKSAARIQSFFNMLKQRRIFQRKREAVSTIQRAWRSYIEVKKVRRHYLVQRTSAILIQRQYRALMLMRKQRAEYQLWRSLIIKLQTRYRANKLCATQRAEYFKLRKCTIAIQQRFRANLQMKCDRAEYLKTRSAIVKIQQKLRATFIARRMHAEYVKLTYHTILIQQRFRAIRQGRIDRNEFLAKRLCVIQLQRRFRAILLMKIERLRYKQIRESALIIQRRFRAHYEMRFYRAKFRGKKLAAICIQQRFREYLLTKKLHGDFLEKRQAAIVIQRRFREWKTMKSTTMAAICIQRRFRKYLLMKKERSNFLNNKQAAIVIQRKFRAWKAMKTSKIQFEKIREIIIHTQKRWRAKQSMKVAQANYQRERNLIIATQRRFRSKLLARKLRKEYENKRNAAVVIQRHFRAKRLMIQIRESYVTYKKLIIRIQQKFRSYILAKQQRKLFSIQRTSVICIQTWFRSVLEMRRKRACFLRTRESVVVIQQHWRAKLKARKLRTEYILMKKSAVIIQTRWRAILAMRQQRAIYLRQKDGAIVLQRHYRARLQVLKVRSQYLLIRSLVICIQHKFRAKKLMEIERENFLKLKAAAILIQQKFRGRLQTTFEQQKFYQIKRTVLGLQTAARGFLARKRYQALMTPELKHLIAQKKAASVIQRFWRGYRVRKRWQNIRLRTIRNNIKLLKNTSSSLNTIRSKVQDAVRILRGRFNVSEALNVLTRLDRMSRTVPHLLIDHSDFISTFCYGIMAQAIRSEVDKQIIELCGRIILNLARYNSTTANTFQESGLVTIAQMLLRWCDKDCDIFNTLCTLIWVFAHCPIKRRKIREFMTTTEAIYLVRETKKLVARKEKMRQNIRKPPPSITTARCKQQQGITFPNKALPGLEPDYGVIRHKPYIFISSVYAFDTILSKLNIDIHSI